jgi:hypothetical protein
MTTEVVNPESSRVEITIVGPETMSKMFDDRTSPILSIEIPLRTRMANSFSVKYIFRRKRNLDIIKLSGSPRYSVPITALVNKPVNRSAISGYDDVAANRFDANRVAITGYRMTFIIERGAGLVVR